MRIAATILTLLSLGCGPAPAVDPQLRYIGTGLDQESYPLAFAVKVANDGDAPVIVDDVTFNVPYKMVLFDDAGGSPPDGFDCVVKVLTKLPLVLDPGQTANIEGLVTWDVSADSPPMLAIVRARFQPLLEEKATTDQEPLIMFLQSRVGALDAVLEGTTSRGEANQVLKTLRAIDGRRSVGFRELLQRIEAAKENEI